MVPVPLACSFFVIVSAIQGVLGNTEIINFSPEHAALIDLPFTAAWSVLSPVASILHLNGSSAPLASHLSKHVCDELSKWKPTEPDRQHCPHELWLVLDLDTEIWRTFDKFTLRISWPAFHPTDISLHIFDPLHISPSPTKPLTTITTHRKYARIQFVHSGVRTPVSRAHDPFLYEVPVVVTLEPLHLGIVPRSVIPVVTAIILVILAGIPIAFKIDSCLRPVAQKAHEECKVPSKRN